MIDFPNLDFSLVCLIIQTCQKVAHENWQNFNILLNMYLYKLKKNSILLTKIGLNSVVLVCGFFRYTKLAKTANFWLFRLFPTKPKLIWFWNILILMVPKLTFMFENYLSLCYVQCVCFWSVWPQRFLVAPRKSH